MLNKLLKILYLLLFMLNISAAQNIRLRKARNSNPPKIRDHETIMDAIQSLDLKLEDAFKTIESNLMDRLAKIDEKIDSIELKLTTLSENNANDEKELPIHLDVNAIVEAMNVELITSLNEIYQSVDDIDKKVKQNGEMLVTLKEHLNLNGNISNSQQQQRKERRLDHSRLISDILSMVRNKLHIDNNSTNAQLPVLGLNSRDYVTQNRNNGSSTLRVDDSNDDAKFASQTGKKPKGGIIFPSVKNKPAQIINTNTSFTTDVVGYKEIKGYSCSELLNAGMRQSGVYYLQIRNTTYWFLKVYCEQEIGDGGWTVIQRRDDFGEPRENFNRDWADYKNGFGDPAKEFWMGNENIYMLTNNEDYALRIELEDFEGNKRYAQYSHFKIHSEADYYKLEIDGYEGNAGDSLNDPWYGSNNSPFSTYNRDNDRSSLNCASMLKGGWWWKSCGRGLNGPSPSVDSLAKGGIIWFQWNGHDYALKRSYMMMKPISKMT